MSKLPRCYRNRAWNRPLAGISSRQLPVRARRESRSYILCDSGVMQARRGKLGHLCAIKLVLHPRSKSIEDRRFWPGKSRRRHQSRPKLSNNLFANCRLVLQVRQVQLIQCKVARKKLRVMAPHAVPVNDGSLVSRRSDWNCSSSRHGPGRLTGQNHDRNRHDEGDYEKCRLHKTSAEPTLRTVDLPRCRISLSDVERKGHRR